MGSRCVLVAHGSDGSFRRQSVWYLGENPRLRSTRDRGGVCENRRFEILMLDYPLGKVLVRRGRRSRVLL